MRGEIAAKVTIFAAFSRTVLVKEIGHVPT
jgi:hypothetical protein